MEAQENKVSIVAYLLVVRVPVLSEQMAVALPIVSQASKCRTKLLSFIIFWKRKRALSAYVEP